MKLQYIFDQLGIGEFSQMSIGGQQPGVINVNNAVSVTNHINLALTTLFSRFTLREGRLKLALQPNQTLYRLKSMYAVTGAGSEPVRYIVDSSQEPFQDDLLKVEKVYTDAGDLMSLNDDKDLYSVTTPTSLQLRVPAVMVTPGAEIPDGLGTEQLLVVYRANHPKLVLTGTPLVWTDTEVELPESHLMALLYFVASRVHNPIGMSNEFHAGNSYATKFELACQELEGQGLQVDQGGTNDRLARNGWV